MLTRLRQATACPSILTTEDIDSSKIARAVDLSEQIISNGEKVVIYSTFKQTLDEIKNKLSVYNPLLCTGDIPDSIISQNIDKFQTDPNIKIMLATWSKMGTGITLTSANNAIFIDCAWTRSANEQAEDRIHRLNQKKDVTIYYQVFLNTFYKEMLDKVRGKQEIIDNIIVSEKNK